jgi:hypothetical protein
VFWFWSIVHFHWSNVGYTPYVNHIFHHPTLAYGSVKTIMLDFLIVLLACLVWLVVMYHVTWLDL